MMMDELLCCPQCCANKEHERRDDFEAMFHSTISWRFCEASVSVFKQIQKVKKVRIVRKDGNVGTSARIAHNYLGDVLTFLTSIFDLKNSARGKSILAIAGRRGYYLAILDPMARI